MRGRAVDRDSSLVPVVVLGAAGVLYWLVSRLPLMLTADGSSADPPVGTAWVAVLPAVAAAGLAIARSELALPVVAGAGVVWAGRLLADLGILFTPDAVLRPEWFGVSGVSGFPLRPTWVAAVALLASGTALVAAALSVRATLDGYEPPEPDPTGHPRRRPAAGFTGLGLLGVTLVVTSALGAPYASPGPVVRPLGFPDIGLFGTAGAALGGLVLALLVFVAAALPAAAGRGLVVGAALASAVPSGIVLLSSAATPAPATWYGVAGAVLLAAAALVHPTALQARAGRSTDDGDAEPVSTATRPWLSLLVGLATLGSAFCAWQAFRRPQVTATLVETGASFDAAGAEFLPAAVVLVVSGVLGIMPATARLGRLWVAVAWVPVTAAFLAALEFASSSIWVSSAVFVNAGGISRGGGAVWGLAAVGLAVAAALGSVVVAARIRDAALDSGVAAAIEATSAERRRAATAWALTVLVLAAYALPVFSANDRPSAALFNDWTRVDGYAAWISAATLIAAAWSAARRPSRSEAVALCAAASAIAAARSWLLPATRAQIEFRVLPGWWVTVVLALAFLGAAVAFWITSPAPLPPSAAAGARRGAGRVAPPVRNAGAPIPDAKGNGRAPRGKRGAAR